MQCLFLEERIKKEGCVVLFAEAFRPSFANIQGFLTTIAEPVSRLSLMHEYRMTYFSLGAAASASISVSEVIQFLDDHVYFFRDKCFASYRESVCAFAEMYMSRCNLARVVIDESRTLLECKDIVTAKTLLKDRVVRSLCCQPKETVGEDACPHFLLKSRAAARVVAERCVLLGYPLQQQYEYEKDTSIRNVNIALKSQTRPRPYQIAAVDAAASDGALRSGCIVLPCGSGKTLVGIMLLCKVKKPTLILCAGGVSVEQWRNQILEFASVCAPANNEEGDPSNSTTGEKVRTAAVGAARISCLTGKQKDEITDETDIVLTTYSMLVTAHKAQARCQVEGFEMNADGRGRNPRRANPKERLFQPYGLLIMDEVHMMPADAYKDSLGFINAKGVVGLTATYVREDSKIRDLFHLVGPKLFDISWERLASSGYLAHVTCIEVLTPLARRFSLEYLERSSELTSPQHGTPLLVMLAAANPNKMLCVMEIVKRHVAESSKILVFCDHIMLLKEYSKLLGAPVVCGDTPHRERLMIFSDFQSTSKVNVVCLSRVGDVSVNLPSANVVVQVSSHGGSRRQEAQRLGRILRPKEKASNGKPTDAWFYTVISTDTVEMSYAAHRTAFLVDQGYTCSVTEFNPDGAPEAAVEGVDDTAPGDVVSIRQAKLRGTFKKQELKCSVASPTAQGSVNPRSLDYQEKLLCRVVASWELDYQNATSQQNEPGVANDTATGLIDKKMKRARDETAEDIKREWNSGAQTTQPRGDFCRLPLQRLVGANDDVVYHES
ncbi:DNA repair helicase and transcription factor protein, putative [Trypanosoma brucei brucei TREU927]|uniref:DNA repair helicase/translocase XPB-R n=1 Tax=Trypanosoma brucei brucei (strain 927/4 GUTat10.1) TaxID=185431 RepID=XPBR_TRYB2|nr:DNA repair helicase and transcription factor protein, putative [Trypanosoma brucei brucei TREU927]Q381F9.1 RecName: Full=DNA repair helicase XPB-R [Trypanosoma brucei brucei TREU927]EAN80572.1 DNA repair helicase and transcription factor protein, putative [Trypanosoma brucei brucei TREU927]